MTRVIPQNDLVDDEFLPPRSALPRPPVAPRPSSAGAHERSPSVQTAFAVDAATSEQLSSPGQSSNASEVRNFRASVYTTATNADARLSFVTARENGSDDGLSSSGSSSRNGVRRQSTGFFSIDNLQEELAKSVDFFDRTPTPELRPRPSYETARSEVEVGGKGKAVVRPATIRFADEKKAYGQKPSVSSRYFLFLLLMLTFIVLWLGLLYRYRHPTQISQQLQHTIAVSTSGAGQIGRSMLRQ